MQQKPNGSDSDFSFAIKRHIGVLSTTPRGWTKELNLVSYNGGRSKLDIRLWSEGPPEDGQRNHPGTGRSRYPLRPFDEYAG